MDKKITSIINSKSREAEAFRTLRTNIQYSSLDEEIKTLVVTSSAPSEGKSTVISNLAVSMAQAGKKVLLVDCDFRKPTIHKKFALSNNNGLTNIIIGDAKIEECLKATETERLYVLTCGTIPPNPSEMLGSKAMRKYINDFKEIFDLILIDAPPVLAVTDAQLLAVNVDGVVLISSYGKTEKKAIIKSKELIENVGGKVLGVVLNMVPTKANEYYYSKYYGHYGK
ncbi:capsular exopolysaccharide family [Clostridium cavendishii DSM 21758]|uniref:non-specific protein-tyrosine kinase n=1 Tax=Clostridium cavendishii DSM 21758 TaxID=1121302 RepID=A0A1M6KR88_9CLOT|nr:CpsD/CapB family tyrosine-protein kinase [Clostridium cavendishii]SHJ61483.1 capsular exopolysaccharide family [Clostridium cavendishii DSM 21758]